jgi:hypothetical protein
MMLGREPPIYCICNYRTLKQIIVENDTGECEERRIEWKFWSSSILGLASQSHL